MTQTPLAPPNPALPMYRPGSAPGPNERFRYTADGECIPLEVAATPLHKARLAKAYAEEQAAFARARSGQPVTADEMDELLDPKAIEEPPAEASTFPKPVPAPAPNDDDEPELPPAARAPRSVLAPRIDPPWCVARGVRALAGWFGRREERR